MTRKAKRAAPRSGEPDTGDAFLPVEARLIQLDELDQERRALIAETLQLTKEISAPRPLCIARPLSIGVLGLSGQGGSGNMARVCAQALGKAGHQTVLLTGSEGFWDRNLQGEYAIAPVDVPPEPRAPKLSWTTPLALQIAEVARHHQLDGLVVHYAAGLLDAAVQAKHLLQREGRTLALTVTLHGTDVTTWGKDKVCANQLKRQLAECEAVAAVSPWLADQAVATFGLEVRPQVIPNSIDSKQFNPARWVVPAHEIGAGIDLRRKYAPRGELVISHSSNLRAVKRPIDAIDAFARVRQAGIAAKLLLIGDGPLLAQVSQRAVELGVAEHVIAAGSLDQEEISRHLSASDVLLVTSSSESFCLAALEAMACGVPVVGTRCGGLEGLLSTVDLDRQGQSGLLAPVGDTEALAERIIGLVKDPQRYLSVQRECARLPLERYPRDRQEAGYLELAESLRGSEE